MSASFSSEIALGVLLIAGVDVSGCVEEELLLQDETRKKRFKNNNSLKKFIRLILCSKIFRSEIHSDCQFNSRVYQRCGF